jgi:hypothetical protein
MPSSLGTSQTLRDPNPSRRVRALAQTRAHLGLSIHSGGKRTNLAATHHANQAITLFHQSRAETDQHLPPSHTRASSTVLPIPPQVEYAATSSVTLRLAARISETTSRIRIAFAAVCPEAALFRSLALLPTAIAIRANVRSPQTLAICSA